MNYLFFAIFLGLCIVCVQNGEAHSTTYIVEQPTYVIVNNEPPADVVEQPGVCPGENYVWVKGYWQWNGCQWVRVHGHWEVRPHSSAAWVPGYWKYHKHHNSWEWVNGYWQ